eukprot:246720-Ditylum_brightwellii.AAC.1
MSTLLPRLGYQQKFPHEVVIVSKYSGGIGFTHYLAYQLSEKIVSAMQQWVQICTGMSTHTLKETWDLPHLEGKWSKAPIQEMVKINGKLHLTNSWKYQYNTKGINI